MGNIFHVSSHFLPVTMQKFFFFRQLCFQFPVFFCQLIIQCFFPSFLHVQFCQQTNNADDADRSHKHTYSVTSDSLFQPDFSCLFIPCLFQCLAALLICFFIRFCKGRNRSVFFCLSDPGNNLSFIIFCKNILVSIKSQQYQKKNQSPFSRYSPFLRLSLRSHHTHPQLSASMHNRLHALSQSDPAHFLQSASFSAGSYVQTRYCHRYNFH